MTAWAAMAVSDAWALLGWAVVTVAVVDHVLSSFFAAHRSPRPRAAWLRAAVLVGAAVTALGITPGMSWAMHLRGVMGDLSAVTVTVAALSLLGAGRGWALPPADRLALASLSFVAGGLLTGLHLAATDLVGLDLYRLGYRGASLPVAVSLLALAAALLGWWRTSAALGAALLVWGLQWPESTNLWDALLDPWWTLWSLVTCLGSLRTLLRRRRDGATSAGR